MYPKLYLYKRITDAKILIDRNFSENIDLDYIAGKVYLSKFHFLRLFKEAYGVSPHKYLITKRIEASIKLLKSSASISEICHRVGFESVQSFSNLFKRHTGMSPSKFKHQVMII